MMVDNLYYQILVFLYKLSIWMIIFCLLLYVLSINFLSDLNSIVFRNAAAFFIFLYLVLFISFYIITKIDKGEK